MEAVGKTNEEIVRCSHVLELVDLGNKCSYFPYQMQSGGEQQRLVIARAIINQS